MQIRPSAAMTAVLCLSACGTVIRGTREDVSVQTSPPGATVTTDIGLTCVGPCVLKVPRSKSFVATASAPGYAPSSVSVGTQVSGGGTAGLAGNLLLGGIVGGAVDLASGSMRDHFPNPVVLVLQPIDPAHPPMFSNPPPPSGPLVSLAPAAPKPQRQAQVVEDDIPPPTGISALKH